jgi:macrolide transport system ATP-binding/permease protein
MTLIRLEKICKTYRRGDVNVPVLKGVSLEICRGEMVAIMGASGSGKTTLLNILGCLDRPTAGQYWLDGEEVSQLPNEAQAQVRNQTLGFVFQNFNLLPRSTALENVQVPLSYAAPPTAGPDGCKRAQELLCRVGLGERMDHAPSKLSGGQQQRVAIARALVNNPVVLLADEPTGNLDSQTSMEILRMFQELNTDYGITIILVTHDKGVANHARRIMHIKDGLIDSDGPPQEPVGFIHQGGIAAALAEGPQRAASTRRRRAAGLGLSDLIGQVRLAVESMRRNVLRSVLTALGVIIGIAAIIAIAELGQGSSASICDVLNNLGASTLAVQSGQVQTPSGVTLGTGSSKTLIPEDAEALYRQCSGLHSVAPLVFAHCQVVYGNRNWSPTFICGSTRDFLRLRDWEELAAGDAFTDRDVKANSLVCLVGQTLVHELFKDESPLDKELFVQNVPLRVIGVLKRKGVNLTGYDQDDIVLAPWTTLRNRVAGEQEKGTPAYPSGPDVSGTVRTLSARYPGAQANLYPVPAPTQAADRPQQVRFSNLDCILVRVQDVADISVCKREMAELLRERHRLQPHQANDFFVCDMAELSAALVKTVGLVTAMLLAVAALCLVVGGVGIMNIMLVSVTERTREIGLRMAVGASGRAILRQFLVEAVVQCLSGAALGIALGRGFSYTAMVLFHWRVLPSLFAMIVSVAVAVTVGVIFGYYPAWKASRLDPIEALRHE